MVTVYTKPSCVQCTATYRKLGDEGIEFKVIDLTTDETAMEKVKDLGYLQAPVVVTEQGHWSGFRPDLIEAITAK